VADPLEAAVDREAASRVLAGEPVHRIVRDLEARDIFTRNGLLFRDASLLNVLRSPRLCGRVSFELMPGEKLGSPEGEPALPVPEAMPSLGLRLLPIDPAALSEPQAKALTAADQTVRVAQIQPLISFDEYRHLVVALAPSSARRYRGDYPFSNFGHCASCGCGLTGRWSKHQQRRLYACARHNKVDAQWLDKQPEHSRPEGRRKHPAVNADVLERFLVEAALASLSYEELNARGTSDAEVARLAQRDRDLVDAMESLTTERRKIDRAYSAEGSTITESEFDERIAGINRERERLEHERSVVKVSLARSLKPPSAAEVRAKVEAGGPEMGRRVCDQVMHGFTLDAVGPGGPMEHTIEIHWRDGYTPGDSAWEQFCNEMAALRRSESFVARSSRVVRSSETARQRMFELHELGFGSEAIAAQLDKEGIATVRGGKWNRDVVTNNLRAMHRELKREYVGASDPGFKHSEQTREMVFRLCHTRPVGKSFSELADELNQVAETIESARRFDGAPWTWSTLRGLYAQEAGRRGNNAARRKRQLSEEEVTMLRTLRAQRKTGPEIAEAFNLAGVKRRGGKPWNDMGIYYQLRLHQVDAALEVA
jgi:hypothetical protein